MFTALLFLTTFSAFYLFLSVVTAICWYFLPLFVACYRKHHNLLPIVLLNLLLGWSIFGWVAALVWACTAVKKQEE